jgi:hypothetical protein
MAPDPKDAPFPTKQLIIIGACGSAGRDVILIGPLLTCAQEYADFPSHSRSTPSLPIRL